MKLKKLLKDLIYPLQRRMTALEMEMEDIAGKEQYDYYEDILALRDKVAELEVKKQVEEKQSQSPIPEFKNPKSYTEGMKALRDKVAELETKVKILEGYFNLFSPPFNPLDKYGPGTGPDWTWRPPYFDVTSDARNKQPIVTLAVSNIEEAKQFRTRMKEKGITDIKFIYPAGYMPEYSSSSSPPRPE